MICAICGSQEFNETATREQQCCPCGSILRDHLIATMILNRVAPNHDSKSIADLCGELPGCRILEIAPSDRPLTAALAKACDYHGPQQSSANIEQLPDNWLGEFDTVILSEVLEHVWDWQKSLSEMARVAAPNGMVIITAPIQGIDVVSYDFCIDEREMHGGNPEANEAGVVAYRRFGLRFQRYVESLGFVTEHIDFPLGLWTFRKA